MKNDIFNCIILYIQDSFLYLFMLALDKKNIFFLLLQFLNKEIFYKFNSDFETNTESSHIQLYF